MSAPRAGRWLALLVVAAPAAAAGVDVVADALLADAECLADGPDCALNALSIRQVKVTAAVRDEDGEDLGVAMSSGANQSLYPYGDCCSGCDTDFCNPQDGDCHNTKYKSFYFDCQAESAPTGDLYPYGDCCSGCDTDFCNPQDGDCHNTKYKSFYFDCPAESAPIGDRPFYAHADCCNSCATPLCNPQDGHCHDTRYKSYYIACPGSSAGCVPEDYGFGSPVAECGGGTCMSRAVCEKMCSDAGWEYTVWCEGGETGECASLSDSGVCHCARISGDEGAICN